MGRQNEAIQLQLFSANAPPGDVCGVLYDPPAAQIGHDTGYLGEIVELIGVLRLLGLHVLALLGVQLLSFPHYPTLICAFLIKITKMLKIAPS